MSIKTASMTLITSKLQETRAFYETHFNARAVFDCGWYLVLEFSHQVQLCLMQSQTNLQPFRGGACLNLQVDDADQLHEQLIGIDGLIWLMPLEDHPWGDRGFAVQDPSGMQVYCYHSIAATAEFQQYFLQAD